MRYGMDMTVGQALKEEGSRKLIETYLPGLAARVCGQNMAMELSIRKLLSYQKESCDAEQIRGLELELERLNELHSGLTEEEAGKIAAYLKIAEQYKTAKETGTENRIGNLTAVYSREVRHSLRTNCRNSIASRPLRCSRREKERTTAIPIKS